MFPQNFLFEWNAELKRYLSSESELNIGLLFPFVDGNSFCWHCEPVHCYSGASSTHMCTLLASGLGSQIVTDHHVNNSHWTRTGKCQGPLYAEEMYCTFELFSLLWLNNPTKRPTYSSESFFWRPGVLNYLDRAESPQIPFCYAALWTNQLCDKQKSVRSFHCADHTDTMCCHFSSWALASMWQFLSKRFSKCLEALSELSKPCSLAVKRSLPLWYVIVVRIQLAYFFYISGFFLKLLW